MAYAARMSQKGRREGDCRLANRRLRHRVSTKRSLCQEQRARELSPASWDFTGCEWSERRDSNPRSLGPEPSAIPGFATSRMVGQRLGSVPNRVLRDDFLRVSVNSPPVSQLGWQLKRVGLCQPSRLHRGTGWPRTTVCALRRSPSACLDREQPDPTQRRRCQPRRFQTRALIL